VRCGGICGRSGDKTAVLPVYGEGCTDKEILRFGIYGGAVFS